MSVRDKWKNSRFIRFVKKFYATHILLKLFLTCVLAMAVIRDPCYDPGMAG